MSMSMHVVGYRPADEEWEKKKAVWDACKSAGVKRPKEVEEFFDSEDPSDCPGREVPIVMAVSPLNSEGAEGFQVDLTHLPKGVRYVRFYCSW